ncbi:MAG: ATP-grasp domain-containing protein [Gaiellaceae bacterium]
MPRIALLGSLQNRTTAELLDAWRANGADVEAMAPQQALEQLTPGDVVVARLDVMQTLDGVEPGLAALLLLEARGVEVVNGGRALLAVHDKLRTARLLARAGVPHPVTAAVRGLGPLALEPPVVVKPRFGSWGQHVHWCDSDADVAAVLAAVQHTPWFQRHGALVQEAVPPPGHDLRIVVAGGRVVGGGRRTAGEGEWRTNVSLGGTLEAVEVPEAARELALTAAAVVGTDVVGVDLLPLPRGGWVVLELNGAVEFDDLAAVDDTLYLNVGRAIGVLDYAWRPPTRSAMSWRRPSSLDALGSKRRSATSRFASS